MDSLLGSRILGGNTAYKRVESDFYPTPPEATQALLDFLNLPSGTKIWEPAAGEHHMSNVLKSNGFDVEETDILTGQDFLTYEPQFKAEWIITNPPFSLAQEFIKKASQYNIPYAFLLKSQYWNAKKRYEVFVNHKPAYVLPLTWRPDFLFKKRGKGSPLMDVMWCVWNDKILSENNNQTIFLPLNKPEV